jgi:hypothetical protein
MAADVTAAWAALSEDLRPHLSPEWSRHAAEHGGQSWVRLILLVDAHEFLSRPRVAEKVAMTMSDLALDREGEQAGWTAIQEKAREDRMGVVSRLVDAVESVLPEELLPLFIRSIEPTSVR